MPSPYAAKLELLEENNVNDPSIRHTPLPLLSFVMSARYIRQALPKNEIATPTPNGNQRMSDMILPNIDPAVMGSVFKRIWGVAKPSAL